MKLLCDILLLNIIKTLKIEYKIDSIIKIKHWKYVNDFNMFYIEKCDEDSIHEFYCISLTPESIWHLDKIQSSLFLLKDTESINEIAPDLLDPNDYFVYKKRDSLTTNSNDASIKSKIQYINVDKQMDICDVYLLIPGKLNKNIDTWNSIPHLQSNLFELFKESISNTIDEEYSSNFGDKLERKCIGNIILKITESTTEYLQTALCNIVKHDTGFCIIEIMIQNCCIGGNKILSYYCGNQLKIIYEQKEYTLIQFQKIFKIRKYGKKRSMLFTYDNNVSEEELINALANEEFPMGKISGDFKKYLCNNIAQYDTAQVYVSQETMVEKCKILSNDTNLRTIYQTIELFFVELILFQDASIDKIYYDLQIEKDKQIKKEFDNLAIERYEQLEFDMAQTMQFSDYSQFTFPTVRVSAEKVAKGFGIDLVFEKYQNNKILLETMIKSNARSAMEKQDKVKNLFLLILSALATVETLGEVTLSIYNDKTSSLFCYSISLVIVVIGWCLYKIVMLLVRILYKLIKNN